MRTALAIGGISAALLGALGCGGDVLASASAPDAAIGAPDAKTANSSTPSCHWPASLNDGGPSGCKVGRAFLECNYPEGLMCKDGFGAISSPGVLEQCISDNSSNCSDCVTAGGSPMCQSLCAPNEYVVQCRDQPPEGCVGLRNNVGYSCCPCQ